MKNTKQEIVDTAILLFNESGFKNVALSQIASTVGISNGNLNYHFKKKDDLVLAIFQKMVTEIDDVINRFKVNPSVRGILKQITMAYDFQLKYRFFYQDTLEIVRAYSSIAEAYHADVLNSIKHIRSSLDSCVKKGIFQPEPFLGAYDYLAHSLWMHGALWLIQLSVLQNDNNKPEFFAHSTVGLFYPYLTPEGLSELQSIQYLGFAKIPDPLGLENE